MTIWHISLLSNRCVHECVSAFMKLWQETKALCLNWGACHHPLHHYQSTWFCSWGGSTHQANPASWVVISSVCQHRMNTHLIRINPSWVLVYDCQVLGLPQNQEESDQSSEPMQKRSGILVSACNLNSGELETGNSLGHTGQPNPNYLVSSRIVIESYFNRKKADG